MPGPALHLEEPIALIVCHLSEGFCEGSQMKREDMVTKMGDSMSWKAPATPLAKMVYINLGITGTGLLGTPPKVTLALRWPAAAPSATSFARGCPRAPFSSVAKSSPSSSTDRFVCLARVSAARSFVRGKKDLAEGALKSPNASNNKTAGDLESKEQVKPTPSSANVGVEGQQQKQNQQSPRDKSSKPSVNNSHTTTRGYANLATAAHKAPNATNNKTADSLGSKPQVKPTPSSANVGVERPQGAPLDWDSFFKLRVRRRYFQLFFSIVGGVGGGGAGAVLLAQGYAEPLVQQVPLDPFFTLGLMTFACAGLGWLIGPSIGSEIFYVINRRFKVQMRQKESQFLSRVRKNRADPSNSNASNPVPDFYGEKIQSVKGYRQWLKDQRAFNKKKTQNIL
ncbi:Presequence translocated-associated motor subunit PAM17 [Paramyrothecium foliicola]|nr:Presequence translocated-associated motor subunit PAM17 [Paramyrothecium foliicola]